MTEPSTPTNGAADEAQLNAFMETALVRERNTVTAATNMLSDAGRADRDRLLIVAALSVIIAFPIAIGKVALGPVELSSLPVKTLQIGALLALIYFALSFGTQAGVDYRRWRSNLNLTLLDMQRRFDFHQFGLDGRVQQATDCRDRFNIRLAAFQAEIGPFRKELEELLVKPNHDSARVIELQNIIDLAYEELGEANAKDKPSLGPSNDFDAIMGLGRRVTWFKMMLWTNIVVTISMPLLIAAVSSVPLILSLLKTE